MRLSVKFRKKFREHAQDLALMLLGAVVLAALEYEKFIEKRNRR